MYRPNLKGPWPLLDLDPSVRRVLRSDGTNWDADDSAITGIHQPFLHSATLNEDYQSVIYSTLPSTNVSNELKAGQQLSLGVAIDGSKINNQDFMYSVSGSFSISVSAVADIDSTVVRGWDALFFMAYRSASGIASGKNLISSYANLEFDSIGNPSDTSLFMSLNKSNIIGDWRGHGNDLQNPYIFGVLIRNFNTTQSIHTKGLLAKLSIHKYKDDIRTYDPGRN